MELISKYELVFNLLLFESIIMIVRHQGYFRITFSFFVCSKYFNNKVKFYKYSN